MSEESFQFKVKPGRIMMEDKTTTLQSDGGARRSGLFAGLFTAAKDKPPTQDLFSTNLFDGTLNQDKNEKHGTEVVGTAMKIGDATISKQSSEVAGTESEHKTLPKVPNQSTIMPRDGNTTKKPTFLNEPSQLIWSQKPEKQPPPNDGSYKLTLRPMQLPSVKTISQPIPKLNPSNIRPITPTTSKINFESSSGIKLKTGNIEVPKFGRINLVKPPFKQTYTPTLQSSASTTPSPSTTSSKISSPSVIDAPPSKSTPTPEMTINQLSDSASLVLKEPEKMRMITHIASERCESPDQLEAKSQGGDNPQEKQPPQDIVEAQRLVAEVPHPEEVRINDHQNHKQTKCSEFMEEDDERQNLNTSSEEPSNAFTINTLYKNVDVGTNLLRMEERLHEMTANVKHVADICGTEFDFTQATEGSTSTDNSLQDDDVLNDLGTCEKMDTITEDMEDMYEQLQQKYITLIVLTNRMLITNCNPMFRDKMTTFKHRLEQLIQKE